MNSLVEWSSVAENPALESGEIHVWRALLSVDQPLLRHLESTFADDEKTRAARFIFDRHRDHYLRREEFFAICLADTLAAWRKRSIYSSVRRASPDGRPRFKSAVAFNVSHSHGLALVAVGRRTRGGHSVELLRPEFAGDDTAKRYFSEKEVRELTRLPVESRTEAFFPLLDAEGGLHQGPGRWLACSAR